MTVSDILEMVISSEKKAGEMLLHAHGIIAENKTDARNVVTEYDRKVQDLLVADFSRELPGAHFFCEENDRQESLNVEHSFIIDPIDGTSNFVYGFRHSCVSVAYANFGEVLAAAVYNPYSGELFRAEKGKGAFLNDNPIHVSEAGLSESIVCFGTAPYYHEIEEETLSAARFLYENALDFRREGSAELDLCSVASGRAGFFVELMLSYWDFAAGALIVEEAGGKCLTADGKPLPADGSKSSVIAGTARAVEDYLAGTRKPQ